MTAADIAATGPAGVDGQPGGATALDPAALAVLSQLDPGGANRLLPRVLGTYRDSLARLLAQLALARERADDEAVCQAVHTLKSSSASVGAATLSALCAAAERTVREDRTEGLPALLDRLVAEAACVDAAVQHLLAEPK